MKRLDGKVILISGGARGQGAAEARLCVAEGARVVIGRGRDVAEIDDLIASHVFVSDPALSVVADPA